MNRKIILLPLVLSALVLAGCGETGTSSSSTASSEETTSSSVPTTGSSSESSTPEQQTWNTIEQLKGLAQGTSFTARAYWMGTCGKVNEEYGTYNTAYVADGANGYIIYRGEAAKIDALTLEPGKTVVEFTGAISNYVDDETGEVKTYECSLDTIKVVDDATGLTAPVMLTLNAANPTFTFDATTASRRIAISDAKVVSNETGNYDNVTVTFTVGTDTTNYTIFFDSRYTDTSLVADLKAGDTFSCESFVGSSRFESIDKLVITSEGGSTEDPDPTTPDLSNPTAIEISAIATTSMDENVVYTTTGILEDLDHADQYGNSYLVDPETGATLQLYGNTTSTSAFVFDEDGNLDYVNPKDAVTTLADVNNGEKVTILFQYSNNFKNAYSVTTAHEACTDAYTVQLPTLENAAIEVNPTSGTYGTEATLTITPDSGFEVTSVTIDHGYGKETLKAAPYTFEIEAYNKVEVALRDTSVVVSTYTLTVDNFENVSGYGNYTGSVNVNGTDVGLAANQIMRGTGANDGAIQMRNKDNNPSYVYNTVALPAAITSIEVTFSSEMTRDGQFGISVGTSELANAPESISWTGTTYTYTPSVSDATYFTIGHSESGTNAMYIASIVITIAA